jgi:hypothetical protein
MNKRIVVQTHTPQSDDLQAYLNQAVSRINRLEYISNTKYDTQITEIARETLDYISPGECEALINTLEGMDIRKNIFINARKYLDQFTNVTIIEEQNMNDTYNVNQAASVGRNSSAENTTINQYGSNVTSSDLEKLADELTALRLAMKKKAVEPDHDISVGEVTQAQIEAKNGNLQKVLEHLKNAGKWALDLASEIGASIATEAIKQAIGIK